MKLAFQISAALVVGVCYYMLAVMMTIFDGVLSLVLQPFVGGILTLVAIAILLVVGLPLRLVPGLRRWWQRYWWLAVVMGLVAFVLMAVSWLPQFRVQLKNPELDTLVDSFHPALGLAGWMLTIFAVLHFYPPLHWLQRKSLHSDGQS